MSENTKQPTEETQASLSAGKAIKWIVALVVLYFAIPVLYPMLRVALENLPATNGATTLTTYPVCADAENQQFAPGKGITKIELKMQQECWSGWVTTPVDWENYYAQAIENKGMEIQFRNGDTFLLKPSSSPWFQNRRGIFRFRGIGVAVITIEK